MAAPDRKPAGKSDARIRPAGKRSAPQGAWPNEGEGSKSADKRYREATGKFARSGRVGEQAEKAAEALDGPEREALLDAERKGRDKARS